ncbi:MAG: GAF domain-containing protein [Candidatus Firestonebacteria bacterium]|nr:GAF domain-containing protein [Candidatus Firestonebacteria bacterium]
MQTPIHPINPKMFDFLDIKPSAYLVADLSGEIVYCNDNFAKNFKLNKRNVLQHLLTEFFIQSDGYTALPFYSLQKGLINTESFELDACIKTGDSKIQSVKLIVKKLSRENHNFLSVKVALNTNQTISDKDKLNLINKAQSLHGNIDEVLFKSASLIYEQLNGYFIIIKTKIPQGLLFKCGYNLPSDIGEQKIENLENSICKPIFSIKKPLILSNILSIQPKINDPLVINYKINSFLGVPIFNHNQEVIGIIALYDILDRAFGPKDIKVMTIFANRIAEELNLEKTKNILKETSIQKDDKVASKFSPIKDVEGFVKKVSGVDMKHIDVKSGQTKSPVTPIPPSDKKIFSQPPPIETANNQISSAPKIDSKPGVSSAVNYKIIPDYIVNWDGVKDLPEIPIHNIDKFTNIAENEGLAVGFVHDNKLIFANKNFINLERCTIDKMYQELNDNNLLSTSKLLEEEKKNPELNEKDLIEHYIVKMTSPQGEVFTGDISASIITLDQMDVLEIIVSRRNAVLSTMMGYMGVPFAAMFRKNADKNTVIKNKISKELKDLSQIYFRKIVDVIFTITRKEALIS